MQNSELPKTCVETRIPKAPTSIATVKASKLHSSVSETKLQLPMIKPTLKGSKLQTTTPSPTSNRTLPLIPTSNVSGTKLRRANSSLAESNSKKINATTNETKLRRVKSTLTETKRPKSQILMSGTKLPKLHQNSSEMKPSKTGSGKLPQLEAGNATRETKGRKTPKMAAESKLPRIHPTSLPLKEINAEVSPIEICKESLENSDTLESINPSAEQMAIMVEPVKTHVTSLPPKVSKTTGIGSSKTIQGAESKAKLSKASTSVTSTKLPKVLPGTNSLPKSRKSIYSTNTTTFPIKSHPTTTTAAERKLPKAQLTLTGLKSSTKPPESKLPKTPTTPDETKLKALGIGVATNAAAETRRQNPTIRR